MDVLDAIVVVTGISSYRSVIAFLQCVEIEVEKFCSCAFVSALDSWLLKD
jgi:hypothetical protein